MISKKFTILLTIYVLLWSLLLIYLFEFRDNAYIFWALIISMVLLILAQINFFNLKNEIRIIYIEIIMLYIGLRMIPLATVGFTGIFGLDNFYEINSINYLLENGKWFPYPRSIDTVSGYPAAHFIGSFLQLITNIEIEKYMSFLSFLMGIFTLIIFMMISKFSFKNNKVTLIFGLGVSFILLLVYMNFGRMLLSIILFYMIIFLILRDYQQRIPFTILIVLSMITLLYSHPMAPIILLLFLLMFVFLKFLLNKNIFKRIFRLSDIESDRNNISFNLGILLAVLIFAYFVYISIWQQNQLLEVFNILSGVEASQKVGTASATPLNWRIFLFGQIFLGVVFSVLFLIYRNTIKNFDTLFFMIFGVILAGISIVAYVLGQDIVRFTIFLWPFILLPFVYIVKNSKKSKIISVILILFIAVNISGYYMDSYDSSLKPQSGAWRMYLTEQEFSAVDTVEPTGYVMSNHYIKMAVLTRSEGINLFGKDFYFDGYKEPNKYKRLNYFFVEKDDLNNLFIRGEGQLKIPYENYLDYAKSNNMHRILDNGDVLTYKLANK